MIVNLIFLAIVVITNFVLGGLVYFRNPKNRINQAFGVLTLFVIFWSITNFLTDYAPTLRLNYLFNNLAQLGAFLTTYTIFIFSIFLKKPENQKVKTKYKVLFVVFAIFFGIFSVSPIVASGVTKASTGVNVTPGILFVPYLSVTLLLIILSIVNFVIAYRKAPNVRRKQQVRLIFAGIIISALLGAAANGVLPILFSNWNSAKYGPFFTLIFVIFTGIAIIKHRLFDIRLVVARSVTYILTIGLIGLVYGFVAFRFANIFLQHTSPVVQQSVYTILAIILAFLFQPIRRFFQKISNAIFYRGKYDAQQLVTEIGRILAGEIQLDQLTHKVIHELAKQMKISTVDIVVLSEKSVHFQTRVFTSEHHEVVVSDLKKLGRLAVVADELSGGEKKEIMQKYGYSVSLALRTSEEFLGYLLLGEKKSGDIYNDEDLRTLKIIANELSVGLQNAKAFAEIQAFNVTLQQKVNEATKNLRNANLQLKELDKAKDEFISMASHQLRTPLTTVKGYVSMLDEGDFGKVSKAQREPLEQALDGSTRMARLIDDLLNVSRMEAGRFFIDATKVDLNKVVPQEIEQLQNMADTKKVKLTYIKPSKPVPLMHLDENKTRQVIMNLADNAVHYSSPPAGGGKVEIRLERDGDDIVYVVRDNGIGVPKDQQDKLFSKMFRARNAQEVRPDGTGLGLYLVKRVVEDQGGKIIFESEPGKGSMFGFRMPIHNKIVVDTTAKKKFAANHTQAAV